MSFGSKILLNLIFFKFVQNQNIMSIIILMSCLKIVLCRFECLNGFELLLCLVMTNQKVDGLCKKGFGFKILCISICFEK